MAKYNISEYKSGSFWRERNNSFNFLKCEDKTVIPLIIKSCLLHWYHLYILHPGKNIVINYYGVFLIDTNTTLVSIQPLTLFFKFKDMKRNFLNYVLMMKSMPQMLRDTIIVEPE